MSHFEALPQQKTLLLDLQPISNFDCVGCNPSDNFSWLLLHLEMQLSRGRLQ